MAKWERLNKLIVTEVRSSSLEEPMKNFLLDILWEEFLNSDKSRWAYSKVYEKLLKKYAEK